MYTHPILKNYHFIRGNPTFKGCLELHSLVDLTIYLFYLNEEVSLSLGIMTHDARRQMLNKYFNTMYFIHSMYKELIMINYIIE